MGKSSKKTSNNSRKTEKSTQSPMLKIFKDMIKREKETHEDKRTFVKEKRKKRKQPHFSSKSKTYDLDSSDKQTSRKAKEYGSNSLSPPGGLTDSDPNFTTRRDDKRVSSSWWLCNGRPSVCCAAERTHKAPSTCSRVSCQFKKIITNEYFCGTLVILFLFCSFCGGCSYAYKMMSLSPSTSINIEADDSLEEKQDAPELKGGYLNLHHLTSPETRTTLPDYYKRFALNKDVRRSIIDDKQPKSGDISGLYEAYLGDLSANPTKSSVLPSYDLSNILDTKKLSEENMNPKIKDFYRKLLETDAQIQNLKKGLYQSGQQFHEGTSQSLNENMFRLKRSLFHHKKYKKHKITMIPSTTLASLEPITSTNENVKTEKGAIVKVHNEKDTTEQVQKDKDATVLSEISPKTETPKEKHKSRKPSKISKQVKSKKTSSDSKSRVKRFPNGTEVASVFEVKRQQTLVRCGVAHPKYRKSNVNKDVHDNEHELLQKNPFYKNSRRLDDLLHHFFDIPFTLETDSLPMPVRVTETPRPPIRTEQTSQIGAITPPQVIVNPEARIQENVQKAKKLSAEFFNYFTPKETSISTKSLFGRKDEHDPNLPLNYGRNSLYDSNPEKSDVLESSRSPKRRLLGYDEHDENQPEEMVGYEDFKEVLSDDMGAHDETDRPVERKKRDPMYSSDSQINIEDTLTTHSKAIPPGVYNPNWKGPLPLYPDEVNSMLKNILPIQKILDLPLFYNHQKIKPPIEVVDAVETYDIYPEHVVSLAQAYSDYGVFKEKNSKEIKSQENVGRKLVTQKLARKKRSLEDLFVKGQTLYSSLEQPSESILINYKNPDDTYNCWNTTESTDKPKAITPSNQVTIHSDFVIISNNGGKMAFERPTTPSAKSKKKKKNRKGFFSRWRVHTSTGPERVVEPGLTYSGGNIYVFENSQDKTASTKTIENAVNMLTNLHLTTLNRITTTKRSINPSLNKKNIPYRLSHHPINKKNITLNRLKRSVDDFFPNTISPSATYITLTSDNDTDNTVHKVHNITVRSVANEEIKSDNETNKVKSKPDDIFLILSDLFAHMANASANNPFANPDESKGGFTVGDNATDKNVTSGIIYPLYDSDMIDNIGHRSRVLLSIEDEHVNKTKRCEQDGVVERKVVDNNATDFNTTTYSPTVALEPKKSNSNDEMNKTNAKRQAQDDSEFVFWNDIYDDEYGVKSDQLNENEDRSSDLVKQSANWFQNKMRKMSNSFRRKYVSGVNVNKVNREKRDTRQGFKGKWSKKREPKDFASLTAHMKEICKQASNAVRETRDMKNKQDPEFETSAGIMQNLVKLMSDLVNFQVHQKTCLKLPDELRGFLEWLTNPPPASINTQQAQLSFDEDLKRALPAIEKDEIIDPATTQSSEKEGGLDVRSECLGTLHAVQDLIQEYAALSEADKVSMGNVMEYLEGQLDYLNKQLNSIDELNLAYMEGKNSIAMPSRYRRDVQRNRLYYPSPPSLLRMKRKFFNYNKKHTKSTYNNVESIQVTVGSDKKKPSPIINVEKLENQKRQASVDVYDNKNSNSDNNFDVTKRNLKDVYYKAIDDAKKTTLKSLHTKEFDDFEQAPVIRVKA